MFSQQKHEGQTGQGLVEYALILSLVAVVVIVVLVTLGPAIGGVYCTVIGTISPGGTCQGGNHYYENIEALDMACSAAGGLDHGSFTPSTDLQAQGYVHGHNCVSGDDLSTLLWIGYHK